jgi:tripeptidyl-peptidase-1
MMAMAPRVETLFWSIPELNTMGIDDVLTWAYAVANVSNRPIVNSLSYGMGSAYVDQYLGVGYLARADIEFQKLGLLGVSVIFSSADLGAGDLGDPFLNPASCQTHFNPVWPGQSPYVTSVGATYATPLSVPICYLPSSQGGVDCSQGKMPLGEVGISLDNGMFWTTGGGFASTSPRPSYQSKAVSKYLSHRSMMPPLTMFNSSNRGYPDVSAIGHNLMTVLGGTVIPIDGTSASAPIFAGIVSLLNAARIEAGKSPMGFLNPLLYKIAQGTPEAFNDVVVGNDRCGEYNPGPDGPASCCDVGFSAAIGWDPLGGLGTPNFPVLLSQVLKF